MGFGLSSKTNKMKNKLLTFAVISIFLLTIMANNVHSEMTFWEGTVLNNVTSTVTFYGTYSFDDTSEKNVGKNKPIPLDISFTVQALPFDLNGVDSVDWCNLSLIQYQNVFDSQGFTLNTTTITNSYYFGSGSLVNGHAYATMVSSDFLSVRMTCHYTNPATLYYQNVQVGRFQVYMPSFQCSQCSQYTLEQLSHQTETNQEIAVSSNSIYDRFNGLVDLNYKFWLYGSWIIKIILLFVAFGLVFYAVYYVYKFFTDVGRTIK